MSGISSKEVISALSFHFSVLVTPGEIIYDNDTQLTSKGYKELLTSEDSP